MIVGSVRMFRGRRLTMSVTQSVLVLDCVAVCAKYIKVGFYQVSCKQGLRRPPARRH
jgi:hypothetical protein